MNSIPSSPLKLLSCSLGNPTVPESRCSQALLRLLFLFLFPSISRNPTFQCFSPLSAAHSMPPLIICFCPGTSHLEHHRIGPWSPYTFWICSHFCSGVHLVMALYTTFCTTLLKCLSSFTSVVLSTSSPALALPSLVLLFCIWIFALVLLFYFYLTWDPSVSFQIVCGILPHSIIPMAVLYPNTILKQSADSDLVLILNENPCKRNCE